MKDALMESETIDSEQINDIMEGKKPRPPADWADADEDSSSGASKVGEEAVDKSGPIGGPASEH